MKPTEKKEQFILLRAEGYSYSHIAAELGISKSTCSKWEQTLSEKIQRAKEDRLEDLYTLYRVGREQHIQKLGETLNRIDEALDKKSLEDIPTDKLLKLKLDYEEKLQALYAEAKDGQTAFTEYSTEEMLKAVADLYERVKAGTISPQKAKVELSTLGEVRRAIGDNNNMFW